MKTGYQFIPKTENCSFLKSIEGTFHCTSFSTKIKVFPLQKLLKQHGQKHSLLMLIVFEKNVLFTMRKTQKKQACNACELHHLDTSASCIKLS